MSRATRIAGPQRSGFASTAHSTSELAQHALAYAELGFSVIPVAGKKYSGRSWKMYQKVPMRREEIAKRFVKPRITGIAVILGQVSGFLCCRDFDTLAAYERWSGSHPELAAGLPIVRTARGFHVYFRWEGQKTTVLEDGELRGEGAYCLLPPSRHPAGIVYQWINKFTEQVPLIEPGGGGLAHAWHVDTEGTEGQRNRGTEGDRGTEVVVGGPNESSATKPISFVFGRTIRSIDDAVRESLPTEKHQNHASLFTLARALIGLQGFFRKTGHLRHDERLSMTSVEEAFVRWYTLAAPFLRSEQSRDEYLMEFLEAWSDAKIPLGEDAISQAFELSDNAAPPAVALKHFSDPKIIRLVTLCRELQTNAGDAPFFLACRTVQRLFALSSPTAANRLLRGLVALKIIVPVQTGGRDTNKATRYKYLHPLSE
jgi:hypothetical protein